MSSPVSNVDSDGFPIDHDGMRLEDPSIGSGGFPGIAIPDKDGNKEAFNSGVMEEAWVLGNSGSKFPIRSHPSTAAIPLTDYRISRSDNTPFNDYVSVLASDGNSVLDTKDFHFTLDEWLQRRKMIEPELFKITLLNTVCQIVRPTGEALALVRSLLKTVSRLHIENSYLSHPVKFGVWDSPSGKIEVILIHENSISQQPTSFANDINYLRELIFDKILEFPNFTNQDVNNSNIPRLPYGLLQLQNDLKNMCLGHKTLTHAARHYSTLDWESRMNELISQYVGHYCFKSKDNLSWFVRAGYNPILSKFLNDVGQISNNRMSVSAYGSSRGELGRYIRNFFCHIRDKPYCTSDFLKSEYVDCLLGEVFEEYYAEFF